MALIIVAVLLGLVLITLAYGVVIYNGLVRLKHAVAQAWSNIDVLLRQRHDELPKLVETCRQYMQFEASALERVMQARNQANAARQQGDVKGVGGAESLMRMGLGQIVATVEAYPELKADNSFRTLLSRITGLEESIADRREYYNAAVNANNVRIEQFPDIIIARMLAFGPADLLQFDEGELADVDVHSLFAR